MPVTGVLQLLFDHNTSPPTSTDVTALLYWGEEGTSQGSLGSAGGVTGPAVRFIKSMNQRWSCSFTLISSAGDDSQRPAVGQTFRLLEDGTLRFSGFIDQVEAGAFEGSKTCLYFCSCSSWSSLFDHRVVTKVYNQNESAQAVVLDIIANLGEGITTANVNISGNLTAPIALNGPTLVSQAFDTIRDMVNAQWWVDESKDLHFLAVNAGPSLGWSIDDTGAEFQAGSMKVTRTSKDYRNDQFVTSSGLGQPPPNPVTSNPPPSPTAAGSQYTTLTDTFIAKTALDFWVLTSQPIQLDPANPVPPTVKVNGVSKTVKQYPVIAANSSLDVWYWDVNFIGVQHYYFGNQLAPNPGDTIEVTYQALIGAGGNLAVSAGGGSNANPVVSPATKNWVEQSNAAEIARVAALDGSTGKWQQVTSVPGISDAAVANELAVGLLNRSAVIPDVIKFDTWRSGYVIGGKLTVNIPYLGLNGTYTVQEIEAAEIPDVMGPISHQTFIYTITLSNDQNIGDYIKWMEGLIRAIGAPQGGGNSGVQQGAAGSQINTLLKREVPAGTIDGVNTTFTLTFSPQPPWSLLLYVNGVLQHANATEPGGQPDYTLADNVITMAQPPVSRGCPQITDMLEAWYFYTNKGLPPQQVNPTAYSTGAYQADGTIDVHWVMTLSAEPSNPGPSCFVVNHPYPAGFVTGEPAAVWIGPRKDFAGAAGSYKFQMLFQFPAATGRLKGQISADDTYTLKLNGTTIQSGPPHMFGQSFDSFDITTGFVAGLNTLEVDVTEDGVGACGILVWITQATSP